MAPTPPPTATELNGAEHTALLPPPLPLQPQDQLLVPALTALAEPAKHRLAAGTKVLAVLAALPQLALSRGAAATAVVESEQTSSPALVLPTAATGVTQNCRAFP